LAWALWLGGWLALGQLARDTGAMWAGGMLPLAVWLALIGLLLHGLAATRLSAPALAAAVLAAAAIAAIGLLWTLPLLAAAGWAALVVTASRVVRALRMTVPGLQEASSGVRPAKFTLATARPAHAPPVGPACAGALLAWALAGNLPALREHTGALAAGLGTAAVGLALWLPRGATPEYGCRAGLFDCALPIDALTGWRQPADWPLQAALLAMLPMMAALPLMAEGCSSLGWPVSLATGAHLAAMLLPGALLMPWLRRTHLPRRRQAVAILLALGGMSLWRWPGAGGLLGAALAHGAAWSLAWAGALAGPAGRSSSAAASARVGVLPAALGLAAATAGLGLAIDQAGPAALVAVHGVIAVAGVAGGLAGSRTAQRAARFVG
jgi:hypothetical protein